MVRSSSVASICCTKALRLPLTGASFATNLVNHHGESECTGSGREVAVSTRRRVLTDPRSEASLACDVSVGLAAPLPDMVRAGDGPKSAELNTSCAGACPSLCVLRAPTPWKLLAGAPMAPSLPCRRRSAVESAPGAAGGRCGVSRSDADVDGARPVEARARSEGAKNADEKAAAGAPPPAPTGLRSGMLLPWALASDWAAGACTHLPACATRGGQ